MVNLDYVTNIVRMDRQEFTTHNLQTLQQYVILGYNELQLSTLQNAETLYAIPDAAMIINLPPNFEYYTKISVMTKGGPFLLSYNPDIPTGNRVVCGEDVTQVIQTGCCDNPGAYGIYSGSYYYPHYRNGQYVGEFYGRSGGVNPAGYFKVDTKRRQIRFNKIPRTEMVIEYVSTDIAKGSTLIPRAAVQTLRHYAHLQMAEQAERSKTPVYDKQRAIANYEIARQEFAISQLPTLDDFLDAIYSGFSPVKF